MNDEVKDGIVRTDPDALPGIVCKTANVSSLDATADDLKKINKYTLSPVTAEQVFTFKATLADNEQDDRNYQPFNLKSLQNLCKLYPGKTMLKDHNRKADNQIARIYDTELIQDPTKTTEIGELHTELIGKIYMIKTDSNADLIAEIMGGIKREVSTSTQAEKLVCNICGVDNTKAFCTHWPGEEYDVADATGKSAKRRCKMLIDGVKAAYELSFVAVPAQPRAGTHKSVSFAKMAQDEAPEITEEVKAEEIKEEKESKSIEKDSLAAARLREAESFIYFNKNEEDIH